ncbi:MAG: signal recognition particle-docking protein FtsY [Candidatus Aenigmatarchaeota archaeon]
MFSKFREKVDNAISKAGKKITDREISEKDLDEVLEELKVSLIESDVALNVAELICDDLRQKLSGQEVKRTKIRQTIKESFRYTVKDILAHETPDLVERVKEEEGTSLVLFLGFNGSGKTSTLVKFASMLKKEGVEPVLAAGDTYRAASIEQLDKHGEKLDLKVIKHDYGSDAAAVIYDAVEHAETEGKGAVLADTAGRSHSDANLMDELEKICRVNDPDWKVLVIDSLTGNDAVEQAEEFSESVGIDGVVLTKMDVNEKGGASLSVARSLDKPIFYIGVGQEYEDLEKFDAEEISRRILSD